MLYLRSKNSINIQAIHLFIYKIFNEILSMKNFTLAFLALAFAQTAMAQSTSCSVTAPSISNTFYATPIGGVIWTPAPTLTTAAAGLTQVQYVVTKWGTPALDDMGNIDTTGGGGNVIIGADTDGIFDPSTMVRYGISLMAGDTFEVTAVGYNLAQVKTIVNKLLTGTTTTGATCCQVINLLPGAAGFCDSLANVGIAGQNDVNSIVDVINVFDAFSARQLSVEGLISSMATVNAQGSSALFPTECGRNDLPICYGINRNSRTKYVASTTIAVQRLSAVSNFMVFPNPTDKGFVNVMVETATTTDLSLRVFSVLGEMVAENNMGQVTGQTTITVATNHLAAGLYIIELTDGKSRQTQKLLVR
jgi:hypothetical protein